VGCKVARPVLGEIAGMERETAIRLLRALVAVGLRQRESMANASIRSVARQAGLDEFDIAHRLR
jgi:hypothetical protein